MSYERRGFVLLIALACFDCTKSGVVGGDCRRGLTDCDGHCVELTNDPRHCGACGHACPSGVACSAGSCGDAADAGAEGDDAGEDRAGDDAAGDVAPSDGSEPDGEDADPGDAGSDAGSDADTDACAPPYNTPAQCGACDVACTEPGYPVCGTRVEGVWSCLAICVRPLPDECARTCTDLRVDPANCGGCGNVCPSGLCSDAQCLGASPGHVVAMCMDYAQAFRNQPTPPTLLGNAVFLTAKRPVRILGYDRYATKTVENQVNTVIGWVAPGPQSYSITPVNLDAEVVAELTPVRYEVFLMYDQPGAPPGALGALGETWAPRLASFVGAGGTVIVLDGGGGEMADFLTSAALLDVSGEVALTGQRLYVRAATDALAQRTVSPFQALSHTCGFITTVVPDFASVFVVTDAESGEWGHPVVVHRAILP